jgi:transcriptional regulator with XRE-family HTH domain
MVTMGTGERIALMRRRRKLTQKQLGEAVGLHANTIARLERGVLPDIPSQAMGRIAHALGCTSDFLLGLSEEESSSEFLPAVEVMASEPFSHSGTGHSL